jgi:CspA family cold shock protein
MSEELVTGSLKWYNSEKGFGFFKLPDSLSDIFVHANQLRKAGITRKLVDGEQFRFKVELGPKGQFATNILPVEGKENA